VPKVRIACLNRPGTYQAVKLMVDGDGGQITSFCHLNSIVQGLSGSLKLFCRSAEEDGWIMLAIF
jgi:hypothetical protein